MLKQSKPSQSPAPANALRNSIFTLLLSLFVFVLPTHAQTSWSYNGASTAPNVYYSSNPLTAASDGNIYWPEQDSNGGAIYQIAPSGGAMVIYSFTCTGTSPCQPWGPVLQGADGFLYGITTAGGANSYGSFFKVALDGTGFVGLYDFDPATDGGGPTGGITLGSDGNFYGISNVNWESAAVRRTHHPLDGSSSNPRASTSNTSPSHRASLHSAGQRGNGSLSCGSSPDAVFFQLTPAGVITFLYCATSNIPSTQTPLVQGSDGNFYGLSTNSFGSVLFQLSAGSFAVLGQELPSGVAPFGALAGGPDGKFYVEVNTSSCGSILQFDPTNSYAESDFADLDCTDASTPYAWQLYLASDGAFYSAADTNSGSGAGSIFRMDSTGSITYPYGFVAGSGQNPYTAPVQNSAGTFFGTTGSMGGNSPDSGSSVIYSLTGSPALAAPVTLTASSSGTTVTLTWAVNNASPLTPPNCVGLVNNSTGVSGWSGMIYGAFTGGVYGGSATVDQGSGTTENYQIVCPSQGAASVSAFTEPSYPSKTILAIGPSSSMVSGTMATLTANVSRTNQCGGVSKSTECIINHGHGIPASPDYLTGTVTFSWNGQQIGQPVTLSDGVAALQVDTSNLAAQTYNITATYSGNSRFASSMNIQTGAITAIPTTTTLTVSDAGRTPNNASTITAGNNATLSAHVTASSGATPSGTVTFQSGSDILGYATLNNSGVAALNLSSTGVAAGSYTVTASYSGNRTHGPATSDGVIVTVSKAPTTTTVSAANSTIAREQPDQLTATVTSNGDAPTGSVHFLWNNYFLCAASLSNGSATCSGAAPGNTAYGPYSITATYMGDHNNNSSASLPTTVTVAAP